MKKYYAKKLTREELFKTYNILSFDKDSITVFDKDHKIKVCNKFKAYSQKYEQIALYNQSTKRKDTLCWHRCYYCLMHGEIPAGLVVDHKDDNKLNNDISNLHLVTPKENVNKYRHYNDVKTYSIAKKRPRSKDFIEYKINSYETELAKLRSERTYENRIETARKDHIIRSRIAYWKYALKCCQLKQDK